MERRSLKRKREETTVYQKSTFRLPLKYFPTEFMFDNQNINYSNILTIVGDYLEYDLYKLNCHSSFSWDKFILETIRELNLILVSARDRIIVTVKFDPKNQTMSWKIILDQKENSFLRWCCEKRFFYPWKVEFFANVDRRYYWRVSTSQESYLQSFFTEMMEKFAFICLPEYLYIFTRQLDEEFIQTVTEEFSTEQGFHFDQGGMIARRHSDISKYWKSVSEMEKFFFFE